MQSILQVSYSNVVAHVHSDDVPSSIRSRLHNTRDSSIESNSPCIRIGVLDRWKLSDEDSSSGIFLYNLINKAAKPVRGR